MGVKHSGYYKMLAPQEKAAGALRGGLKILSASVFVFVSRSHQDAHAQQGIDIKKAAACLVRISHYQSKFQMLILLPPRLSSSAIGNMQQ